MYYPCHNEGVIRNFEPFERDSKHSNRNSNHSKEIRLQIRTTWKWFEVFKCNFEPLQRDSKHSNPNSNNSKWVQSTRMQIQTIRKGFKCFESKFEPLERDSKHWNANSNHSKRIRSIRIQIRTNSKRIWMLIQHQTTRKGFEAFNSKFEPLESDSKHSNANSNHSKEIRSIGMQIPTIRKGFKAFESKFKPLERGSKQSNEVSNLSKGTGALESKFKSDSNPNSNH